MPMTPDEWLQKLKSGHYQSASNAGKSLGRIGFSGDTLTRAKSLVDRFFEDPKSMPPTFFPEGKLPEAAPAPAPVTEKPKAIKKEPVVPREPSGSPMVVEGPVDYLRRTRKLSSLTLESLQANKLAAEALVMVHSVDPTFSTPWAQPILDNIEKACCFVGIGLDVGGRSLLPGKTPSVAPVVSTEPKPAPPKLVPKSVPVPISAPSTVFVDPVGDPAWDNLTFEEKAQVRAGKKADLHKKVTVIL